MDTEYQVASMQFRILRKVSKLQGCKRRDVQQAAGGRGASGDLFALAMTRLVELGFIAVNSDRTITLLRPADEFPEPIHPSIPSWDKSGRKFVRS